MTPRGIWLLRRYGPFAGIALALVLVLALAPTKQPDRTNAFAGAGTATGSGGVGGVGTAASGTAAGAGGTTGTGVGAAEDASGATASGGASGAGAAASAGAAAAPAQAAAAGEDCARRELLGPTFPCKPTGSASNPGETYQGVTADAINIVIYHGKSDPLIDQALATQDLSTSPEERTKAIQVFTGWLSKNFQTWGRKANVIEYQSEHDAFDSAAMRAEAAYIADELKAFMTIGAGSTDMMDELARRGVLCVSCGVQHPAAFYNDRAPFIWGLLPDGDTTNRHIGEHICKRLGPNSTADFAGPGSQGKPRKYGIAYPQEYYGPNADMVKRLLNECGIPVEVMTGYTSDINTGAQQATNVVAQFKTKGVTTFLCICDPVAPFFVTTAAKQQDYWPEWYQTGYFLQDADAASRFYDQDQWNHSFGVSVLGSPRKAEDSDAAKVYAAETGGEKAPPWVALGWPAMLMGFMGIETAGPQLDPATFEQGMFSIDFRPVDKFGVTIGWGPGDYGGIDDAREVWWDKDATSTDGNKGTYRMVNDGRRYLPGEWPAMPTNVFKPECEPRNSCGEPAWPA